MAKPTPVAGTVAPALESTCAMRGSPDPSCTKALWVVTQLSPSVATASPLDVAPIVVAASEPRLPLTPSTTLAAAPGLLTTVSQRAKAPSGDTYTLRVTVRPPRSCDGKTICRPLHSVAPPHAAV